MNYQENQSKKVNVLLSELKNNPEFSIEILSANSDEEVYQIVEKREFDFSENESIELLDSNSKEELTAIFYPDNAKRKERLLQLINDTLSFMNDFYEKKAQIDEVMETLSENIKDMYVKIGLPVPKYDKIEIHSEWIISTLAKISSFVVFKPVKDALFKVAITSLLKQGRIGEAAFAELMGLPTWYKIGINAGGFAAVIGVELIIDGIEGAVAKGNLRKGIHDVYPKRVDLRFAQLKIETVYNRLNNLKTLMDTLKILDYNEVQIEKAITTIMTKTQEDVLKITETDAIESLNSFDKYRDAWTNEDTQ